jgi:hypothetical protein
MIIAAGFIGVAMLCAMLLIPPDAANEVKTNMVGIMAVMLFLWFWKVRRYGFLSSTVFSLGISIPTANVVTLHGGWWSTIVLIVGLLCSLRAFSVGPAPQIRQRV